jgi:hypothetical protein
MKKYLMRMIIAGSFIANGFVLAGKFSEYYDTRRIANRLITEQVSPDEMKDYQLTDVRKDVRYWLTYSKPYSLAYGDFFTIMIENGKARLYPGM